MGRPREFNEAEVLHKVTEVFRARGYEGTSIGDLEAATGVGRASLYGAFGDKRQLFLRVLGDYSRGAVGVANLLRTGTTLREGLQQLCDVWTATQLDKPADERGCFALQAAVSSCEMHEAQGIVWCTEQLFHDVIVDAIRRAREGGEVGGDAAHDSAIARLVVTTLQGVAASARVVPAGEEAGLRGVKDSLVNAVFALLSPGPSDGSASA